MDVLDRKSEAVVSFFTAMDEMLAGISLALKDRTPRLNGEKFLTNKDVCGMLNVSTRTLQEWRSTGKIPFIRLEGKILYRESEILKWLAENQMTY
jgi:excisionase family DNA binding protein